MKKRILLFTSSILVLSASIMSYNIGPARMNGEHRTGANGGVSNCSNGGCHSGGSYVSSTETISIYDLQFNQVTSWVPGQTYTVIIGGQTTAPKYGFQVSASYNDGSYHPAGVFDATNPGTHDTVINGYSIVEQDAAFVVPGTQAFGKSMKWTAPANIIVDTVYFYCTLNNVNGDATQTGDNSTNFKQKLGCATASVPQLNAGLKINTYPNPVTDKLNISIDHADKGTYTISVFDMHGKLVNKQTAEVNGAYTTSVNTAAWAAGMYHVQLKKGNAQKTIMIVKD